MSGKRTLSLGTTLSLLGGAAMVALFSQSSQAYTYNCDSPDATRVLGADFAGSLGPVKASTTAAMDQSGRIRSGPARSSRPASR
jgi:hypothetical protein